MKKRFFAFFVALTLLLTPACAADTAAQPRFSDVPGDAWYAEAAAYCDSQGWMRGTSGTKFSPDGTITRAMLATVLYRYAGSPAVTGSDDFTDTDGNAWYADGILWAYRQALIVGYGNGCFGTNDPVSREQLATILWRNAGSPASEDSAAVFEDQASIASYAADAVAWARENGVIHGKTGNRFDPKGSATRAELAVILKNMHDAAQSESTPPSGTAPIIGGGTGSNPGPGPEVPPTPENPIPEEPEMKLLITVGTQKFTATLADTDAAQEFAALLPQTFDMNELNGNEKYCYMEQALSAAAQRPGEIHAGDLMLYGSNCLVLFYESFSSSYSYTSLGHIDDPAGLAEAVGHGSVTVTVAAGSEPGPGPEGNPDSAHILVAYFSATNTTRPLAEYAADLLDADLYEIVPEVPYTEADLKYYTNGRADQEQSDPAARPAIRGGVADMSRYDVVFLGYPIWHGQAPRIISTFLESYDFAGKTVVPFCTSHSSGYSDSTIKPLASGANWLTGRRFPAGTSKETLKEWIDTLHLPKTETLGGFDLAARTVTLNSGYVMPINGLGTYSLHGDTCVNAVKSALASGVRLIDTAHMYGNEEEVGQAIREAMAEYGIEREEIFVITKIYPGEDMANPEQAIQACLDRLNIGYVDMMLLHHPDPNDVKAYKAMEQFAAAGKIRSLGLSNWYVSELKSFLPQVDTVPALVQNEIHPYYQENDVIPYIQSLGITVQGWYPLGGRGHTAALLGDETISAIAQAHGVSSAQVILRWNLQKGVVVIPGSGNPDHIRENTALYHFELSADEMSRINALDRGEKHDWY